MRRVLVISDLHIGGDENPMLGHPKYLTSFLEHVAANAPTAGGDVELVVNGDFVDFLAERPSETWTATEAGAVEKLDRVLQRNDSMFDAFARCAKVVKLTVLLGNHDVELAYPRVRETLFRRLGTDAHRCAFVSNNECYRVGDLAIEHGNLYDPWNAIDHDGLRHVVSRASRGEESLGDVEACPGSRLVCEVMNPLKARYHFVDLLKPEDKIVTLLLTALEPSLQYDLPVIFRAAANYLRHIVRRVGQPARRLAAVDADAAFDLSEAMHDAFKEELDASNDARTLVASGRGELTTNFMVASPDDLATQLRRGDSIEGRRLRKLQVALREKLHGDVTFITSDASGAYCEAATQMIERGAARVVVMGHTHLARNIALAGGRYINTGTWADLIRLKPEHLEDSERGREGFQEWLRALVTNQLNGIRCAEPTYADITIDAAGHIVESQRPMLRRHDDGPVIGHG